VSDFQAMAQKLVELAVEKEKQQNRIVELERRLSWCKDLIEGEFGSKLDWDDLENF